MYKRLPGFTHPNNKDILWRYLSFEKFASLLATESLHFARADTFEDPYESLVPPSIMHLYEQETLHLGKGGGQAVIKLWDNWRKWVMCCCWHRGEQESMAMWGRYDMHNSGIAIKTTVQHLKNSFICKGSGPVYICKVRYINYKGFKVPKNILDMNTIYLPFFYKRKEFRNEHEVRAIIDTSPYIKDDFFAVKAGLEVDNKAISLEKLLKIKHPEINDSNKGRNLKVDLKTLIDEVIISPYPKGEWVAKAVKKVVRKFGYHFPVYQSKLLEPLD